MAENSGVSQGMELKVTERHVLNAMLRQWLVENYNDSRISDKM